MDRHKLPSVWCHGQFKPVTGSVAVGDDDVVAFCLVQAVTWGGPCAGHTEFVTGVQRRCLGQCHSLHAKAPADAKIAFVFVATAVGAVYIDFCSSHGGCDVCESQVHGPYF